MWFENKATARQQKVAQMWFFFPRSYLTHEIFQFRFGPHVVLNQIQILLIIDLGHMWFLIRYKSATCYAPQSEQSYRNSCDSLVNLHRHSSWFCAGGSHTKDLTKVQMGDGSKGTRWRDREVFDLISIWGDSSIQAKHEGSYHNWSVFEDIAK